MRNPKKEYPNILDCRIELHSNGGEWSGLYIDGELDTYGDTYHAEERCFELLGGIYVSDSEWLHPDQSTPYQTVAEINEATALRQAKLDRAAELRAKAAELEAEAAELVL